MLVIPSDADLVLLWVGIILCIIACIIFFIIDTRRRLNILTKLDLLIDEPSTSFEEVFTTPNKAIDALAVGFVSAHPACISWKAFKEAVEAWPRNELWYIFAKFALIYPSESGLVTWIFHTIKQLKLKGQSMQTVKQNIIYIMRMREAGLTPELKNKINTLSKQTTSCKHKLRQVWDAVIQANTGEVEESSKMALKAITVLNSNFKHILRQFPNNRYITRVYSAFLHDLMADYERALKYAEMSRTLGRGIFVVDDEAHELDLNAMPSIPLKLERNEGPLPLSNELTITRTEDIIDQDEQKDESEVEQTLELKKKLKELRVTAVRNLIFVRLVFVFVIFLVPAIYFFYDGFTYPDIFNSDTFVLQTISKIRNYNTLTVLMAAYNVYETMGVLPDPGFDRLPPMKTFANYTKTTDMTNSIIQDLATSVQDLERALSSFRTPTKDMEYAYSLLSQNTVNYTIYKSPKNYSTTFKSVQQTLLSFVQELDVVVDPSFRTDDKDKNKENVMKAKDGSTLLNPVMGYVEVNNILNNCYEIIIDYFLDYYHQVEKENNIIMLCISLFIALFSIVYEIVEIKVLVSTKVETYKALIALPKNVVSQVSEKLRLLKKDTDSDMTQNEAYSDINKQEDNILKILATSESNAAASDVIILVGTILLSTAFYIICICTLAGMQSDIVKSYVENAPHLNYFIGSLTMRSAGVLNLIMLALESVPERMEINDINYWRNTALEYFNQAVAYNNKCRFGGTTSVEVPFSLYKDILADATAKISCSNDHEPYYDEIGSIKCYDPESILYIHTANTLETTFSAI